MELKHLGINNVDKYKNPSIIDREAKKNYNDFTRTIETYQTFGSNEKMLTNIQQMRSKIEHMLSSGRVGNNDFNHNLLESALKQAVDIQLKSKKSMDDIWDFYTTYNNFQDISIRLGGSN